MSFLRYHFPRLTLEQEDTTEKAKRRKLIGTVYSFILQVCVENLPDLLKACHAAGIAQGFMVEVLIRTLGELKSSGKTCDKYYTWERRQLLTGDFMQSRVRKEKLNEFASPNGPGQDWCPDMENRKVWARENMVRQNN